MVYSFNHMASLSSFRILCKDDPEEDFFHNITHLQVKLLLHSLIPEVQQSSENLFVYLNLFVCLPMQAGKRSKALSLFRQGIKENNFSEVQDEI